MKDEEEEKEDLQPKEDEQEIEEEEKEEDEEEEQGQAQQRMQGHYDQHVQQQSQPNRAPQGRTRYTHLARALKERSKSTKGGEVVEVNGGHIAQAQAIGRKDRHSKVCTSKGPRDRRLRLAAHTAIQFYDVQDRLGFDRPSKAIDWLMEKAKAAIEALATANSSSLPNQNSTSAMNSAEQACLNLQQHHSESETIMGLNSGFGYQNQQHSNENSINSLSFISEAANANVYKPSPPIQFHDHFPPELNSRTIIHTQDLCLSLQSFQDPVLDNDPSHVSQINFTEQAANSASAGLSDLSATDIEIGWFQRTMMSWNSDTSCHGGGEDCVFNSLPPQQSALQNQLLSHRGPLQSNNLLSVSAWTNPPIPPISINSAPHNRSALSSQTSPRFQIEEQEYNATSERSSSTCSPCHY